MLIGSIIFIFIFKFLVCRTCVTIGTYCSFFFFSFYIIFAYFEFFFFIFLAQPLTPAPPALPPPIPRRKSPFTFPIDAMFIIFVVSDSNFFFSFLLSHAPVAHFLSFLPLLLFGDYSEVQKYLLHSRIIFLHFD